MLLFVAGFLLFNTTPALDGVYHDTYADEILPGDASVLRGIVGVESVAAEFGAVEADVVEGGAILETAGPASVDGTGARAQEPTKTLPTVDKIAV